ncbi:MAG: mechanosensitive ion channel [Lysobacteraceae bacterium]|nr:MAG: mechanosensitive ion channel [Xanthomonadaceae bacterium]
MSPPHSPLWERRKPRPLLLLILLLLSIPPLLAHAQSATEDPEAPQPVIEQATEVLQQPASQEARDLAAEVRAGEQSDSRIASAVTARLLRHPRLQQVTVAVNSGIVTLGGEVLADADRDLAGTLAKSVDGVGAVSNQVAISANLPERMRAALAQTQQKLVRLVGAIPLLVVALAIVYLSVLAGKLLARRPMAWLRRRQRNPFLEGLVRRLVQSVVVVLGLVLALNLLGATALVGAVLGSAGVIGLVVGFAFKDIAENYMAGILLSLRRPFAPDDHLVVDKYEGKVIALTSRATLLMTLDGNQLSLPNALVFKSVVLNYTANPRRRFDFVLPIDPSESAHHASEAGLAAIAQVDGVLLDPAPSSSVDGYNAKGLDLRFFGWIDQRRNDLGKTRSEALRAVRGAFAKAGVHGPETVRYLREESREPLPLPVPGPPPEPSGDTSVNRDIDEQLAAAQRAHDDENLASPETDPKPAAAPPPP